MSIYLENLHVRLVEELKRVGPPVIAKQTGIARATVYNWMEKGNVPMDKLALLETAGADVNYILTGQRTEGTASDPAEQVLLDSYRRCKPDAKANLIQMAALLSAGVAPGPAPKAAPRTRAGSGVQMSASAQPSIAVRGSRNVVAGRDVVQTKVRK